eukprot:CAMPEP_0177766632 /NCGR_PEP_ID=MMETSP0491_2-20121128/8625_1 /TAXON_ID=63592 /ORGANISM="Tetraselmis chuii, Strain PLY429" /LENGTH=205 /DNA_ID=CAMNT_0019283053 /DNA_START=1536 /DNA_END=2154 /DNA_ORIENTATION=+
MYYQSIQEMSRQLQEREKDWDNILLHSKQEWDAVDEDLERSEQWMTRGRHNVHQYDFNGVSRYQWENSANVEGPGGVSMRSYQSVVVIQSGPQVYGHSSLGEPSAGGSFFILQLLGEPSAGGSSALLGVALFVSAAYAALAAAFSRGYHVTKFIESPRQRLMLVLLWPFFFISKNFRMEFRKALQDKAGGRKDGHTGERNSSTFT